MTEPDFAILRREFPVLARKTYLNSGSYCALASEVKAAFEAYLDDRLLVGANWDLWITKNEAVRALTASLLRALPDEIAVTASVSAGLNALASAVDFSGSARLLRMPDLGVGRELEIAHDDLVARAREVDSARQGVESRGNRGGDRDLVG